MTNTAIANSSRQIDLLKEYRTRLIADVVTGKIDVREAAARLPEEDLIAKKRRAQCGRGYYEYQPEKTPAFLKRCLHEQLEHMPHR